MPGGEARVHPACRAALPVPFLSQACARTSSPTPTRPLPQSPPLSDGPSTSTASASSSRAHRPLSPGVCGPSAGVGSRDSSSPHLLPDEPSSSAAAQPTTADRREIASSGLGGDDTSCISLSGSGGDNFIAIDDSNTASLSSGSDAGATGAVDLQAPPSPPALPSPLPLRAPSCCTQRAGSPAKEALTPRLLLETAGRMLVTFKAGATAGATIGTEAAAVGRPGRGRADMRR